MKKLYYVRWYEGGYEETEHFKDYLDAVDFARELNDNGTPAHLHELVENEWLEALA